MSCLMLNDISDCTFLLQSNRRTDGGHVTKYLNPLMPGDNKKVTHT